MNARDYLAKKGIGLDREEGKPQTLEEMAWSRAREAGEHPPRSGTPFDWEDWERHHGRLAEDAGRIAQKINHRDHGDENDD